MLAAIFTYIAARRWTLVTPGLLVALCLCVAAAPLIAQSSPLDLRQRRTKLSERIETTTRLLNASGRSRAAALDRLVGLQQQVAQREQLVELVRLQIAHADASLGRTEAVITSMEADVAQLSDEYGRMARAALRQNLLESRASYLLSAESLSDAFLRVLYLKRYDENRRRQLSLIAATREALADKLGKLDDVRARKQTLLLDELAQRTLFAAEVDDKNQLLASLRGDEARLRDELLGQRADRDRLDAAISNVIADANAAVEARQRSEGASTVAVATTSERYSGALAADFATNRGRLPWPVAGGFVSKPFGRRQHPTLPKVELNNNGIDIRCDAGATVRAVFEGEVVGLQNVPGYHTMVILQHGDYYTVYSNLVDVSVKPGARIGTADVLGSVAVDATMQGSELHFEVWQGKATQDPGRWVRGD